MGIGKDKMVLVFFVGIGVLYKTTIQFGIAIILDLTVVLNFAIDGVWINSLDDFGERFKEKSVSQLL